jgi:hypothetical protein
LDSRQGGAVSPWPAGLAAAGSFAFALRFVDDRVGATNADESVQDGVGQPDGVPLVRHPD